MYLGIRGNFIPERVALFNSGPSCQQPETMRPGRKSRKNRLRHWNKRFQGLLSPRHSWANNLLFIRSSFIFFKGLTSNVTLSGRVLSGWTHYPLPFNQTENLEWVNKLETKRASPVKGTLSLFSGSFAIQRTESELADTFLHLPGWHKVINLKTACTKILHL